MDNTKAQDMLGSLVSGVDPLSGESLASDSVLRDARIVEALSRALEALAAPRPTQRGRPWNSEEEERLVEAHARGTALPDLARDHSRSLTAIEERLQKLGRITPEERVTRSRYASRPRAPTVVDNA